MQEKTPRKNKAFRSKSSFNSRKSKQKETPVYLKPEIAPVLKSVLAQIGKPHPAPFVPDDFQLKALAATYAERRIVSVLEGGYALHALGRSATAHIKVLSGL